MADSEGRSRALLRDVFPSLRLPLLRMVNYELCIMHCFHVAKVRLFSEARRGSIVKDC